MVRRDPPRRVEWRCPFCMRYWPLPALWDHLRDAHGWDRDRYEATRQGSAPRRKEVA